MTSLRVRKPKEERVNTLRRGILNVQNKQRTKKKEKKKVISICWKEYTLNLHSKEGFLSIVSTTRRHIEL